MADDDSVIQRRLLIDGDGTGDDRRINLLLKSFIKWSSTEDSPEKSQIDYDRMLCQLRQCEFTVQKSEFATKMIESELKNYEIISKTIDSGIGQAKILIDQNKQKLVSAKKNRKQRMEYDALAKVITQEPDRKGTAKELEILNKELNELKMNRKRLEGQLQLRRNEFTVLMRSIAELQGKLDTPITNGNDFENDQTNDQPIEAMEEDIEPIQSEIELIDIENMSGECDGELPDSPIGCGEGSSEN